jgi:hypothetical protein
MIRTQQVKLRGRYDNQWSECYIHREHSFGDQMHVACSEMLVCPRCRDVWAYLIFRDEVDCWPTAQFCENCVIAKDDWHPVPGSLLVEEGYGVIDDALLAALPYDLVKREFDLHLKAYQS